MKEISDDKIKLFRSLFSGREDVYAIYWKGKDGRSGYSPACRNKFQKPLCNFPCHSCCNSNYSALTDQAIRSHLVGGILIGSYALLANNSCRYLAADFDNHNGSRDPLTDAIAYREVCDVQGIPAYIERSKSGKGYHAWIFFSSPVAGWKARAIGLAIVREAGMVDGDDSRSFDRLFPNQPEQTGNGLGNLIALPLWGGAKDGCCAFLDMSKSTIGEDTVWEFMKKIKKTDESTLDEIITEWGLARETSKSAIFRGAGGESASGRTHGKRFNNGANFDQWVSELLIGVSEGGRNQACAKLAGHYLRKLAGDVETTINILTTWDERNSPPMGKPAVEKVVNSIRSRQGKNELGEAFFIDVTKIIFLKCSDGSSKYIFHFKNGNSEESCQVTGEQLISQTKFRGAVAGVTNMILPPIKNEVYFQIMKKAVNEAEITTMSRDVTLEGIILGIIQIGLGSVSENVKDIDRRIVLKEEKIYLKVKYIHYHLENSEKLSRQQIGSALTTLGFKDNVRIYDDEKNRHRVWAMDKKMFDKMYEERV